MSSPTVSLTIPHTPGTIKKDLSRPLPLAGHPEVLCRPHRLKGVIAMELLLGLAALGGLAALLLQSKTLPSEEDFKKAQERLNLNPADAEAALISGKYRVFVLGDYGFGMQDLAKGSDTTLKVLAQHELDEKYTDTPVKKVAMGDEWVVAARKSPALSRTFYDRAAHWYSAAWPGLDEVWKTQSRQQGRKLAASRPPGAPRRLPTGWAADPGNAGKPPVLDGTVARSGSYSAKLIPADPKVAGSISALRSVLLPVSGKVLETSAYVLSDGTENAADRILVRFYDQNNNMIGSPGAFYPVDLPFWNRIAFKSDIPKTAVRVEFLATISSKEGNAWIDDVSMKADGKEILKNGSFDIP